MFPVSACIFLRGLYNSDHCSSEYQGRGFEPLQYPEREQRKLTGLADRFLHSKVEYRNLSARASQIYL
jgi:hypothetical protein